MEREEQERRVEEIMIAKEEIRIAVERMRVAKEEARVIEKARVARLATFIERERVAEEGLRRLREERAQVDAELAKFASLRLDE